MFDIYGRNDYYIIVYLYRLYSSVQLNTFS